ncbi:MAG: hypothetical protein AAGG11_19330 [Pseudomonadota bacterium]
MGEFIRSGAIVDFMLVFVAVEVIVLLALYQFRGFGLPPLALLLNIGAGTSLMLALRSTLYGHDWPVIAVWLLSALAFHVSDLAYRFRAAAQPRT